MMNKKYEVIYLDMDGVLCDWMSAVLEVCGKTWADYEASGFHLEECMGFPEKEIWRKVEAKGLDFWTGLTPYAHMTELIELAEANADDVIILTSPHRNAACFGGKFLWLEKYLPDMKFVVTKWKYLCAKPNTLLIDDYTRNISEYTKAGGEAVLFPAPWNKKTLDIGNPVDTVRGYLAD